MSESNISIQITISDPELSEYELQQVTQDLQAEISQVDGVLEVNQVPVSEVEAGAKDIGGFLNNILTAQDKLLQTRTKPDD